MSQPSYPADATARIPVTTTVHDYLVAGWVGADSSGSSPDGRAPVWTIDIGGTEYPGPPVDAAKHNSVSAIREMLRDWAKQHPELFA